MTNHNMPMALDAGIAFVRRECMGHEADRGLCETAYAVAFEVGPVVEFCKN
jgi:hypothetical protein